MPANKSQHFVPQFYLRNFGHGNSLKLICLYNLQTGKFVPDAAIKNQACADYFYEKGQVIESALSKMETSVQPIISQVLRSGTLPNWGSQEHLQLLKFLVYQRVRTQFAVDEADEQTEKMNKKVEELCPGAFSHLTARKAGPNETQKMLLSHAEIGCHIVTDLRFKLFRNTSKHPFITSDHPVARYNQLYEHPNPLMSSTGFGCRGLQLFFPLNSQYLLVVFDSEVYKVGGRNFKVMCVDVGEDDVDLLNILQVVNAGANLYFSLSASSEYIADLVKKATPLMKSQKAEIKTGPSIINGKEHGTMIHTSLVDFDIGLDLSCMKILPKAKEKYGSSTEPHIRYRDINRLQAIEEFVKEVRRNKFSEDQFDQFCKGREKREKGSHTPVRILGNVADAFI